MTVSLSPWIRLIESGTINVLVLLETNNSANKSVCSFKNPIKVIIRTLIFSVPPKSIRIEPSISKTDTRYLNVSCQVEGVYPVPIIDLSWTKKYGEQKQMKYYINKNII